MLGFFNINKNKGVSSAYVVNKIKRFFKCKCGHMGTLDPLACGVLPVGLGQATRLFDTLLKKNKKYIADFDFSFSTPSFDLETPPDNYSPYLPTKSMVEEAASSFIGAIEQVPPLYSAICIDGVRSYKLVRKGRQTELPSKKVTVNSITVCEQLGESVFRLEIDCSSGTYIRSLVRDMASKMGIFGTMTALTRVQSGFFNLENSVTLDELLNSAHPEKFIIKPDAALDYPTLVLENATAERLINGLPCCVDEADGAFKVYNNSEFWGVGNVSGGILKMKAFVRDL